MYPSPYLADLARNVAGGLGRLPDRFRSRQADYVLSTQNADGGFSGRRGQSDLYYVGFALRALDALDVRDERAWGRAGDYVRRSLLAPTDIVECFSLLHAKQLVADRGRACWADAEERRCHDHCRSTLARFCTPDGGSARSEGGPASLYHTFLAALCRELLREPACEPELAVCLVKSRQRPDAGFSDLGQTDRGETNPTAAAVALLKMLDALDDDLAQSAEGFLLSMQRRDGGFAAHGAAPVSDLLSTFTAVVALGTLGAVRSADLPAAGRFVQKLAVSTGGFRGALVGDDPDVEYTYYGLGVLGLLSNVVRGKCC